MRLFLTLIVLQVGLWNYAQSEPEIANSKLDSSKSTITTKLNVPFGTISKLNVEIYDGDKLQRKEYQGVFLFKINSINDKPQNDTLLMTFLDETGQFANDDFELYKLTYGKSANSVSSKQVDKMKEKYVGKKFTLMAYETGQFSGMPKDYFKYRPIKADRSFHFQNYLIVVSSLTK